MPAPPRWTLPHVAQRCIFITVAERSADQHAAHLVRCLRQLDPELIIEGLGGPLMREAGAVIHHDTVTRAAMGWRAALRALEVSRLLKWTRAHFDANQIDLQICCDSWSMNCHFARLAHDRAIPVLYYIAPQTWASREGRVKRLRKWVNRVACILPFEQEYFRRHDLQATFVGHPLFDELPKGDGSMAKKPSGANGPRDKPLVIGLLAGSRKSIARANFPRLLKVARSISERFPGCRFLCPTTSITQDVVKSLLAAEGSLASSITVALDAFDEFVPQCDLCITVSGTAALHVAAHHVPLIVVYHGNPILWHLIGRWVVKTRTYSLVNLLSDFHEHIVPEFIPWYGSTDAVARCAIDLLEHPQRRALQRERLGHLIAALDKPGASMNVARMALDMLKTPPSAPVEGQQKFDGIIS